MFIIIEKIGLTSIGPMSENGKIFEFRTEAEAKKYYEKKGQFEFVKIVDIQGIRDISPDRYDSIYYHLLQIGSMPRKWERAWFGDKDDETVRIQNAVEVFKTFSKCPASQTFSLTREMNLHIEWFADGQLRVEKQIWQRIFV